MSQQNKPHHRTYQQHSPRRDQLRAETYNAREELERERQLYSAHDPRQSAPSPAQRYAQARQEQQRIDITQRQSYWSRHPQEMSDSSSSYRQRSARTTSTSDSASLSRQIPRVHAESPRTSHTPHVGEATLSGRIPRQSNPSTSSTIPRVDRTSGHVAPSASSSIPHINEQSGRLPRYDEASTSRPMEKIEDPTSESAANDQSHNRQAAPRPSSRNAHTTHKNTKRAASDEAGPFAFSAERYLSADRPRRSVPRSVRTKLIGALALIVIVAIGVFAFTTWDANRPVNVTINGEQQTIEGQQRSLEGLIDTETVSVMPGNYVAVDGSVMREGQGTRATASVNGQSTEDFSIHLNEGDDISLTDGTDITEEYTDGDVETIEPTVKIQGTGAVHMYTQVGVAGEKVQRTGNESGITAEVTTKEPIDGVVQYYNVNTNGEKVIALTFDDGPWDSSTEAILDILKDNDAKATFFTVGEKVAEHKDLVKRAVEEGHEVGTHTWDHAEGSGQGVSLILMSTKERIQEVEKGLQAIEDASGQEASRTFRSPGGNFDEAVATDLNGIITSEIGWNVDTNDWQRPGTSTIAQRIESVGPGEIVLMHDGGGDRSETVEALRQALPKLKEQGYRFVTVDELISAYPYQA